jgi:asparagine N-glycosylation enzyme membrane subunit Stt3
MFDFYFENFITSKAIRYLYGLVIFLLALLGVVAVIGVILEYRGQEKPFLVLGLIGVIVATTATIAFLFRLWCESVIVRFRVAESLELIQESLAANNASTSDN